MQTIDTRAGNDITRTPKPPSPALWEPEKGDFHPDTLLCQFFQRELLRGFILKSNKTRK